jgi:HSP20 family protein
VTLLVFLQVVRRERHFSSFTRSFVLPDNVKEDGIAASLDKGVLRVTVPKVEPAPKPQPKRIAVKGGEN